MSFKVTSWALNEAPVEQPVQVLILVAMAERCNDDGTCSYQSVKTIASKARISPRTVHREFKNLETMGVIRRGNQSATEHLPVNRRPVVYDLAVELRRGDNLSYQESGVTRESVQEESGVTSTTVRGDIHDSLGVTLMADNSSFITSPITTKEKDPFVLKSPEVPDHPNWMTPACAIASTDSLTKIGKTLVDSVQSYYASPIFNGTPDERKYVQWLMLEVRCHTTGAPLPVREVVRTDTPASMDEAFELFWVAFPNKKKRQDAFFEFTRAVKTGVAADLIITGAKRFANSEVAKATEEKYMPMPANWLREKRWTDVYKGKSWSHTAADD